METLKKIYKKIDSYFLIPISKIVLTLTVLGTLKDFNSLEKLMDFLEIQFQNIHSIFMWIAGIIHYILIPWNYLTNLFFGLIPLNIPDYLYNPIILLSLILPPILNNFSKKLDNDRGIIKSEQKIFSSIPKAVEIIKSDSKLDDKVNRLFELIKISGFFSFIILHGPIIEYYWRAKELSKRENNFDYKNDELLIRHKTNSIKELQKINKKFESKIKNNAEKIRDSPLTYEEKRKNKFALYLMIILTIDYWIFTGYESASTFIGGLILSFIVTVFFVIISTLILIFLSILVMLMFMGLKYLIFPRHVTKQGIEHMNSVANEFYGDNWTKNRNLGNDIYEAIKLNSSYYINEFLCEDDEYSKKQNKRIKLLLERL